MQQDGLLKKSILTETELTAIMQLTERCNHYENLHMRLSFTMLRTRSGDECNDFLYYEHGMLVGYLALDSWGVNEKEAIAMVHPAFRRKGIFKELLATAKEACQQQHITTLLLICEQASSSGQACIQTIGGRHSFSEHEMLLVQFQDRSTFDDRLSLHMANVNDVNALAAVLSASFHEPEPLTTGKLVERFLHDTQRHIYLATFGNDELSCKEPVGTIRLDEFDGVVGIYGFGVIPDYRGRGYGRQILEETIRTIRSTSPKPIMLDVDTDNTSAIGLYKSCGFQIKTTYDYYSI